MIVELVKTGRSVIFAVPYRERRARQHVTLPDGAIVEIPNALEKRDLPLEIPQFAWSRCDAADCDPVGPASSGSVGLATAARRGSYARLAGVYLLPDGDVAAVYGCRVEDLNASA